MCAEGGCLIQSLVCSGALCLVSAESCQVHKTTYLDAPCLRWRPDPPWRCLVLRQASCSLWALHLFQTEQLASWGAAALGVAPREVWVPPRSNVSFRKGLIEDLKGAGVQDK